MLQWTITGHRRNWKKEEQISAKENTRVFQKEFEKSGICWNKLRNTLEKTQKFWEQSLEKNGKLWV